MKLTFYLFDETVRDHREVFLPRRLVGDEPFEEVPLRVPVPGVRMFLQLGRRTRPAWLDFAAQSCELPDPLNIWNVSNSLVVVAAAEIDGEQRFFAATAGYGFAALDRDRIERDFGLYVTLNTVDATKLRAVQARTLGTVTQEKLVSINKPAEVWELGVEPDQELIAMLRGKPADDGFASSVSGSDALSVRRAITVQEIPGFCVELFNRRSKEDYRKHFAFVDRLRPVKRGPLQDRLNEALTELVIKRDTTSVRSFLPAHIAESAELIEIRSDRGARAVREFELEVVYAAMDELELRGPRCLFDTRVSVRDADGRYIHIEALYHHLVHEGAYEGDFFAFSAGKWYRISADHIERVNALLADIEIEDCSEFLPPMMEGEKEPDYNRRAAEHPDLQLMDRATFHAGLGGRSKVEVCDLLHRTGAFICAKKFSGSSDLSHLLAQGSVSANLFFEHQPYRQFTADQITRDWLCPFDVVNPRYAQLRIVYAVACPRRMQLPADLPFFSKTNLLHHRRLVRRTGFRVRLAKIPIEPRPAERQRRRRPRES